MFKPNSGTLWQDLKVYPALCTTSRHHALPCRPFGLQTSTCFSWWYGSLRSCYLHFGIPEGSFWCPWAPFWWLLELWARALDSFRCFLAMGSILEVSTARNTPTFWSPFCHLKSQKSQSKHPHNIQYPESSLEKHVVPEPLQNSKLLILYTTYDLL